ncbi:MAG: hypothetical protein PHW36_00650 [Bacilli bacterium]|nr:hypothetical protein [Bacilli bacterium]
MTKYEGVSIHIPIGAVLTITKGDFFFKSEITDSAYTCKKVRYEGNGSWVCIGEKVEQDFTQVGSKK